VVARRAHNPEVVGSNPTPATNEIHTALQENGGLYSFQLEPERCYNTIMASKADDSNIQSILNALQKLSPADRQAILQTLQSGPKSILKTPTDGVQDWQSELRLLGLTEGTVELYSRTIRKILEQYPRNTLETVDYRTVWVLSRDNVSKKFL
jgi:hypothetical protein